MKHKSKINLSLILLIIGIGMVPTGIFIKSYLNDQVSSEISPFLENLESQMVNTIEDDYLGLGIYNVLPAIHDDVITSLEEDYALIYGMASTLKYLKNTTIEYLPQFINTSQAALSIVETFIQVRDFNSTEAARLNMSSIEFAREVFFNNYTYQDDLDTPIEGVSEHMIGTSSLNYNTSTINYLLYGRNYNGSLYLGLANNAVFGEGLLRFLELYNNAEADIGMNRTLIQEVFNCTWSSGQLQNLSAYIKTYLFDEIVKAIYTPLEIEDFAIEVFYDQWANASWVLSGFNLKFFSNLITENLYGMEVGRNNPTNISIYSSINLWDSLNNSAFINNIGIYKWYSAYKGNSTIKDELMETFKLNENSIDSILQWLFNTIRFIIVPVIYSLPEPIGIGMSMDEYAEIIYLEQWANGTHIPEGLGVDYYQSSNLRPNGDNETSWSHPEGINHYENIDDIVVSPRRGSPDYIATEGVDADLTETFDMQTVYLPSSGRAYKIVIWIYGYSDYGLNNLTVDINMNGWQGAQDVEMTNESAWYSTAFFIDEANGTGVYLDALQVRFKAASNVDFFHNHYISTMYAVVDYKIEVRGFEVGIPIKSDIPLNIAHDLLNTLNTSSFIDRTGILKWIDAYNGDSTARSDLIALFKLDLTQFNLITSWLFTTFRYDVVPLIASDYTGIGIEDYARYEFYRQWSDRTLYNQGLNLSAFLIFEPFYGWELGIPTGAQINESIVERLWDDDTKEEEPYAITNFKGISIWFKAMVSSTNYDFLLNTFDLTTSQMDQILDWLITIRENYVVPLLREQLGLPIDYYTYTDTLFLGIFIAGITIMGIGVLGVVATLIIKRR
ncbi:MAG: hypothetical protein ACFFEY_00875 [Candidatus Thorarchaeota archaeon]